MAIALNVLLLVVGFVLLIKGADLFVDASVDIARRLRVPSMIIGLTIVALGTSAPEAVVSVTAALRGSNTLAVGNAVGSNIFNLLVVAGACAAIKAIPVSLKKLVRDYWISVVSCLVLILFMVLFNEQIPRWGGFLLFVSFIIYMVVLIRQSLRHEVDDEEIEVEVVNPDKKMGRMIFFVILGVALIVGGGQLTVSNAVGIATAWGISERVIGLTIVAVGTSLPELITSIVASKKGENEILLGNVIGSNIFNLLFVLGLSGSIHPLAVSGSILIDLAVLVGGSLLFLLFAFTNKRISRGEGVGMILVYVAYMAFIIA